MYIGIILYFSGTQWHKVIQMSPPPGNCGLWLLESKELGQNLWMGVGWWLTCIYISLLSSINVHECQTLWQMYFQDILKDSSRLSVVTLKASLSMLVCLWQVPILVPAPSVTLPSDFRWACSSFSYHTKSTECVLLTSAGGFFPLCWSLVSGQSCLSTRFAHPQQFRL